MGIRTKPTQQTFTGLIRPHLERMYKLAYRLTGHREDAQDLVQDVLLKLYPQCDRLAEVETAAPWLGRVLYRQFIDNKRQYAARNLRLVGHHEFSADPDQAPALQASTEHLVDGEINISRIEKALASLSEDHRLIIILHDVEGYSLPEIVEITGVCLGTIKSRRQRARERLQELLDEGPDGAVFTCKQDRSGKNYELRSAQRKLESIP